MLGQALHIAAVQGDYGIGTAISGAFRTIIGHSALKTDGCEKKPQR
jgi:hypothetical protein